MQAKKKEYKRGKKSIHKPITKIINNPLHIKLRQFTQEKLDVVQTKIKNREVQKEYKTGNDCVKHVIQRKQCKKLKFDHTTKWYIHNPESVLNNEMLKLHRFKQLT